MAQNDNGAASWPRFTTDIEDAHAELTGPALSSQRPFQQQLPPMYQNHHGFSGNPSTPSLPESNNASNSMPIIPPSSHPSGALPLSFMGSNRRHFHPPAMYSYESYPAVNPSRSSPTPNVFDQPLAGHTLYHEGINVQNYPFAMLPGYMNPPLFGSFHTGPVYSPPRNDQRTSGVGSTARNAQTDSARGPYPRQREPAPGSRARDARPPPQAPSQPREQTYPGFEPPPWISFAGPSRRSDRSTSPRASNRRNFERYSVDLSQSSTSSDAEEAAARAPPSNRMRYRPREVRPRPPGRQAYGDSDHSTARQINILKVSLSRHLPSALPEDASKTCDICQKDYAATLVAPTEEEENAVQLVCGHRFGEFCIGQWLDTCREHKNKVTCPMCRTQLIEVPRWIPPLLHASPRGQAFIELVAREQELLARAGMQAHEF